MFWIFFSFLLAYSNFLDPYQLDKGDLDFKDDGKTINDDHNKTQEFDKSDKKSSPAKIQTEDIFAWPKYFKNDLNYGIGASLFYSFKFVAEKNKSIPSLLHASLMFGSNDYFNSSLLIDTFWSENKNNLSLSFNSVMLYHSYYTSGFDNPSLIGNYNAFDYDFLLNYRRYFKKLYFGVSYFLKSTNLESDDNAEIADKKIFLSAIKIGVDNIPCTNILYKTGNFLYGVYYYSYNKFLGSDKNLNSLEFNLEKIFHVTSINKLIVGYDYNLYLDSSVPYLALFSPYGLLKPYSKYKYLDKQYMSIQFDLRILLSKNTYLSLNGAGFQSRSSIREFLLDDFMYSYGFALIFPLSQYLNTRFDYSINKDEKNFYIGLSN